jgi:hypothetical protein
MPSTPTRRAVLRSAAVALGGVAAGCVAPSGGGADGSAATASESATGRQTTAEPTPTPDTGTYADAPSGPEPYPDRPSSPTVESVRQYAKYFEYARAYNKLHEPDAEEVNVEASAAYDVAGDGGHYAVAKCTGYANYEDGLHADWGQLPALYFVTENLTVRVADLDHEYRNYEEVFAADDPAENVEQPGEGRSSGYRVYNLDPESHDLSVTVEFLGGSSPVEAFATDYDLGPASGLTQESVTYRRGEYRLSAELASGARTEARWTVDEESYARYRTAVVVSPTGSLSVRRLSFDDL